MSKNAIKEFRSAVQAALIEKEAHDPNNKDIVWDARTLEYDLDVYLNDGRRSLFVDHWGVVEFEDSWGGEGHGSSAGYVLKVTSHAVGDLYVGVYGSYNSWDGYDWDYADWREVKPRMISQRVWDEA